MSVPAAEEVTFCAKHPEREASLRCIRCDRLMCTDCLVRAPTGYICKECARRADDKFFHGTSRDYGVQGAVCLAGTALATALVGSTGLSTFFFALFLGPLLGGAVAELALRLTGRRRGRYSDRVGTGAAAAGAVLVTLVVLPYFLGSVWHWIFVALLAAGVYGRFQVRI
ncbi:MAG: B-box zinc finger protein [Anaerolineae bacterium]|jgi:hypothetical protein|nr:B-box zinc finger protein [Anaerolineae bacterium]